MNYKEVLKCLKMPNYVSNDFYSMLFARSIGGGTSKKVVYGIRIDPDIADPYTRVTYLEDAVGMTPASMGTTVFDYGSWAGAFFMPKPCVLNYDGTVAYYLDPNDYGKKIDGTPSNIGDLSIGGNVMLEFPKIYFKYVPNESGRDGEFYVSNHKVDDTYECWCNYDADNNEIDHFYMAAYNGCCYDGKMRSISGLTLAPYVITTYSASATYAVGDKVNYQSKMYECITAVETAEAFDSAKWQQFAFNGNTTGTEEMTYARANNAAAKDEWLIDLWADAILIWGLLILMGKTTALQETFGRGIDSGSQAAAEAYVTGSLDDKGLFYGNTVNGNTAVKAFGIENFWGCKWHRCAGFFGTSTGYAYKLTHGTKDGSTASSFGTSAAGYLAVTAEQPASDYIKNMLMGRHGLIAGVTGSPASSSAYYCDYFYKGMGFALFGGASCHGRDCGIYVCLSYSVYNRAWGIAAALSCKPLKI